MGKKIMGSLYKHYRMGTLGRWRDSIGQRFPHIFPLWNLYNNIDIPRKHFIRKCFAPPSFYLKCNNFIFWNDCTYKCHNTFKTPLKYPRFFRIFGRIWIKILYKNTRKIHSQSVDMHSQFINSITNSYRIPSKLSWNFGSGKPYRETLVLYRD